MIASRRWMKAVMKIALNSASVWMSASELRAIELNHLASLGHAQSRDRAAPGEHVAFAENCPR